MIAHRFMTARGALLPLAGLCLGLGAVIELELTRPGESPGAASVTPGKPGPVPALVGQRPDPAFRLPGEHFAEVTERPLFSQTRRPPAAETASAPDEPGSLALAGIVISSSSRASLVQHGSPPVLTRYLEGQQVDGWAIRSIQRDRIVLQRGAEERELKLRDGAVAGAPAMAAPIPMPRPPRS